MLLEFYLVATHVFATTVEENKSRGAGTLIDGTYKGHGMQITREENEAGAGAIGPGHSGPGRGRIGPEPAGLFFEKNNTTGTRAFWGAGI